jgi:glycosyltransferase involved in cell wall biosynthesis
MPPRVSVIVPARNEAAHLPALLASLASLTFPKERLEVIVVDHESTDETARIAKRAGATVVRQFGGTISSVRNAGAKAATGELLAFLDADCTVDEDWLARALPHFEDAAIGAVGSYHLVPMKPRTWIRRILQKQIEARPRIAETTWLPSGNMIVRRSAFWECGGFDESLMTCEDVDLCYRLARRYKIVADSRIRCWHHGEPTTLWEVFRKELWRGRDNFAGAVRHGLRPSELPSLVLPIYVVCAVLGVLATPLVWTADHRAAWWWLAGSLAALVGPLFAISLLFSARIASLRYLFHFAAYFFVYFIARGLGPIYAWRNI